MFMRDPLSTDEPEDGGSGPSLWAVLGWSLCIPLGISAWLSMSPDKVPAVTLPTDVPLPPQVLESYRALPPHLQLANIHVEPYGTEADIYCETLEPLRVRIRYASQGRAELTTMSSERWAEQLHLTTLENLKPDTEYRFRLTSLDLKTDLPRISRTGSFRTRKTDDAPPEQEAPEEEDAADAEAQAQAYPRTSAISPPPPRPVFLGPTPSPAR